MPRESNSEPSKRRKNVVVIVRLYYALDPHCPNYEQYCQQKLVLHVPFHHQNELLSGNTTFTAAYANLSNLATFLHLWKMTSTDFKSCFNSEEDDSEVDLKYHTLLNTSMHSLYM